MLPSTFPSIYSDSEPVISPLMNRPLPMVAWSPVAAGAARTGSGAGAGGIGTDGLRGGGGVMVGWVPVWLGFHIALKGVSFSVLKRTGGSKAGPLP